MTGASLVGLALAVSTTVAAAQGPVAGAAIVSGRVVAAESGDPVPNARVTVNPAAPDASAALTDNFGRFTLDLPPDVRTVAISKTGYIRATADATPAAAVEVRLRRGSVISGRIADEFGDPVVYALVGAEPASGPAASPRSAGAVTNDRGEYRLSGLPAGDYLVSLQPAMNVVLTAGQPPPPPPSRLYYPGGVSRENAEPVHVDGGAEAVDTDLAVPGQPPPFPVPGPDLARSDPLDTGSISGRIVSTDGRALAHAWVFLMVPGDVRRNRSVRADDGGRYLFSGLAGGRMFVAASKPGYAGIETGDQISTGPGNNPTSQRPVTLKADERREEFDVTLARRGTVSGQILDEFGDPIEGARVQLLHVRYEGGRRRLVPAGSAAPTNDLGRYRAFNIMPGQYIVSVTAGDAGSAQLPGYARTYYPNATTPSAAQFVAVALSQEVDGIDIALARGRTFTISGTVFDAAGQPTTGGSLQLLPSVRSGAITSVPVGARLGPNGGFAFPGVAPGQYVIRADRGRRNPSTEGEFGTLAVTVADRDVKNLVVQTSAGSTIRGRVVFERVNDTKPPASSSIEITPVPVDPDRAPQSPASAEPGDDWTFAMTGVNGPRRLDVVKTPGDWALREIRVRGVDATNRPMMFGRPEQSLDDVEVLLTDRVAALTGTVMDGHATPAPGAHVIVFSTDRDRWYPASRYVRIAKGGDGATFSVVPLPPDSYYVIALKKIPSDGDDAWRDPEYLMTLITDAISVSVADGESRSVTLRLH